MVADLSTPAHISREFAAAPEDVFDAWTDPEQMRRWMFVSPTNQIEDVTSDCRVGGRFSIQETAGGEDIDHAGLYLEVSRPHRLILTLAVPKHFAGMSCIAVEIAPHDGGSLMTFSQIGVDRSVTEDAWRAMFDGLAQVVE